MFLLQFDRWAAPILKFDQKFYANVSVGVLVALPIAVASGMILNAKLAWIICSVMLICIVPFATAVALPEGALRRGVIISAGVMLAAAIGWYLYRWFGVRGSSEIAVMRFVLHSLILSVIVSIPFAVLAKWKVGEARVEE